MHSAIIVLTLALGIGAASTAQSVIAPLLLRPLPFAEPDRLITLGTAAGEEHGLSLLAGEYDILRARVAGFERLSLLLPERAWGLATTGVAVRVTGAVVTPEFFATMGVPSLRGTVVESDLSDGGVVVLSHALWLSLFGGAADVIGVVVRLDGSAVRVAAVMPRAFDYPARAQLWLVRPLNAADVGTYWGLGGHRVVGRLRAGMDPVRIEQEIRALSPVLSAANPLWTPAADYRSNVRVISLHESIAGDVRTPLLLLAGAVGVLLLIACANVANLVLARGLGRAREMAVRAAIGASGARIVRQLLAESVVLALMGGAAGVGLALIGVAALRRVLPPDLPRVGEAGVDARVLAASLALTLVTGVLIGILPARHARRFALQPALRDGTRTTSDPATRRLSGALVVTQVALAVLLVSGAALLVRSLLALQHADTGLARMEAVTARVDLPGAQYTSGEARSAFYDELLRRAAALPGVRSAALTGQLPFSGEFQGSAMAIEHVTTDPNDLPILVHRRVTPALFDALGVALRRGRIFDDADMHGGAPVAIVDDAAARAFWPGQDPIGRRLGRPWINEQLVVVGVVGAVLDGELASAPEPTIYTPLAQEPPASAYLVIDSGTGLAVLPALRDLVRAIDPGVPLSDAATMQARIDAGMSAQRLATTLLGGFGLLAVLLAAIGLYALLAYAVGQRSREFAVRLALGARAADLAGIVLREGGTLVLTGVIIGIAGAVALGGVLGRLLYGVDRGDPITFLVVATVFAVTAALAIAAPALRASRLDPIHALKE